MSATLDHDRLVPPTLSEKEKEMVRAAERMIMKSLDHSRAATITIESDDGATPSGAVPPQILKMLGQTLGLMARREPIVLVHEKQEFSTVEAQGWVERLPDPADRRGVIVRLTPRGRTLADKAIALHFEEAAKLLGFLSKSDRALLEGLLAQILLRLENGDE